MKTALVTGSSDGIGKATAIALARRGVHVVVHGRNRQRAQSARDEIAKRSDSDNVAAVSGDFAALDEVRLMAETVLSQFPRIDVLINNAAILTRKRQVSADGYELTFAVNHLAPFLLTNLLLDRIRESGAARIINVSSMTHAGGNIDFRDLQMERTFNGQSAYANSKLANILFTNELARRLAATKVTVNSLHPGVIDTKLLHVNFTGGAPVANGARTPVYLATSTEVEGVTGAYFVNEQRTSSSPATADEELAARLWQESERLTGLN